MCLSENREFKVLTNFTCGKCEGSILEVVEQEER